MLPPKATPIDALPPADATLRPLPLGHRLLALAALLVRSGLAITVLEPWRRRRAGH